MDRVQLQSLLESITEHVYFQPPANLSIQYPCIVYSREFIDMVHADNASYRNTKRYQVTVIDRNPDSDIPDKVAALPLCSYSNSFVVDNLNHDVFRLFF